MKRQLLRDWCGALSLVWQREWGPVLAGSMDSYRQNEPNNMQMPRYQFDICTTPRLEVRRNGSRFASSNDLSAWVQSGQAGADLWAETCGQLRDAGQALAGGFHLRYTMGEAGFALEAATEAADTVLYLPVISAADEAVEGLGSGTVRIRRGSLTLTVRADKTLDVPPAYRTAGGGLRRLFNPMGGFQFVPLTAAVDGPVHIRISVTQEGTSC